MPRKSPRPPIVRGVTRDCDCIPSRGHGHHHTYDLHGCGCDACRAGGSRYVKQSRYLAAQGRQRRRAAEPVRRRIELLKERGYTVKEIAAESGIFYTTLFHLLRSGQATVNARTADAVMAVPVPSRRAVA